jgi:hypothetical protein
MGGTMTLNQNELHDLIWDEWEDFDNEQVQKTRYLPSLWFKYVQKWSVTIFLIDFNYFLVYLP